MFDLSTGKLFIRKRSPIDWLVFFVVAFPFLFAFLFDLLRIPDVLKFLIDVALVVLAFALIIKRESFLHKRIMPLLIFVFGFFVYTLILYAFNFQSPFYYFWGLRNNFRGYIAFFVFALFIRKQNADELLSFFDFLYWVNFATCLFQFFVLGLKQDYLGGIFGTDRGCNGFINIFICVIITKSIVFFLNKKEKFSVFFIKVGAALILSAIAELKFFIVEFIILIIVSSLITKFSWRKLIIIVVSIIGVVFGISLMVQLFPEFMDFFSLEKIFLSASSETGYTFSNDLNRLTALPVINKLILETPLMRFFGLGLGNCDLSSIAIFNTPFYERYSELNYDWFSYAFMYLETGYIGMVLFFLFYILCFVFALRRQKKQLANKEFCQMSMLMSVMCCIIAVYGSSLRSDAVYMAYFILALPFIDHIPGTNEHPTLQGT